MVKKGFKASPSSSSIRPSMSFVRCSRESRERRFVDGGRGGYRNWVVQKKGLKSFSFAFQSERENVLEVEERETNVEDHHRATRYPPQDRAVTTNRYSTTPTYIWNYY